MKLVIEKKDIEEVISIAKRYYGVIVAEEKAQELIKKNRDLAKELADGGLDTVGRSVLADAIVQDVLKNVLCEVRDRHSGSKYWEWPMYGSTEEYKEAFDKAFKENAEVRGYKLAKCWN